MGKHGKKLTQRVRKLVKGISEGKRANAAAKDAGLNPKYAYGVLKEPHVKDALAKLMDRVGLSDTKVFQAHAEMLKANRAVSAVTGKDAGAGTVDFIDVPDWQARGKAIDMAHKIKGRYVEKVEHSGVIRTVRIKSNVNLD